MSVPHDIAPGLTVLFRAVLQASWQGSLAIVLVLLVRRLLGRRVAARWHYLLWFLVLARLLVPTVVLPHGPASLANIRAVAAPFSHTTPAAVHEVPDGFSRPAPLAARIHAPPVAARTLALPILSIGRRSPWSWWSGVVGIWVGGALVLVGWLAACTLVFRRQLRRDSFPVPDTVLVIWQRCCRRWLRRAPPRLLVTGRIHSPALVGWWRPTLLLPRPSLTAFSDEDWEHVFAHEIAHLRWRDHWSQLLLLVALCVHWFNPVVWLGFRRLRADRELAADEWALRHLQGDRALAYGETLFKTLTYHPVRRSFQPGMVGISEDGAQMKQRLRRITAFLPRRSFYGSAAGFAVLLLLGTLVLGQGSSDPAGNPSPSSPPGRHQPEALEAAVDQGDASATRRLILDGMDANAAFPGRSTPLVEAAKKDRLEIAQLLLEHGARADQPASTGRNDVPLAFVQSVPMAELLKKNGASLTQPRGRDLSLLLEAVRNGNPDVVTWFIGQGLDPRGFGIDNQNLLCRVADARTAKVLLESGVDPNQVDQSGRPALSYTRSAEVAQVLIDHGAKVNGLKEPLLPRMVQTGSVAAMEVALKAGADHDPATLQQTLLSAVGMDNEEVVRLLLRYGANPNESGTWPSNFPKELPLEVSCTFGGLKTARLLLAAGANPNGGKAPGELLKAATRNGYKELSKMLHDAGATGVSDLAYAIALRDEEKIKALLATAPAYTTNPGFWDGALPGAARVGDLRAVRAALEHGVPIQPQHGKVDGLNDDDDAFGAAAFEGQWEALAILLAARPPGDDPARLRLALWDAVMNSHPYKEQRPAADFERCVQMLIDARVPAGTAQDGIEMVGVAVFTRNPGGNPNVIEMLVKAGADPNPTRETDASPHAHLLDAVREAHARGQCSAATAETVEKLSPPATPALPQKLVVTPKIKKAFQEGNGIEIREITGTTANFQVGGTYRVTGVCRQHTLKNATLYIGNTAERGADAIAPVAGSSLYTPLPVGDTEFDCTVRLLRPGVLHVTVYDLDNPDKHDNAYAGIELGNVGLAVEAISHATRKNSVNAGRVSMADGTPLGPDPITAFTHYENGSGGSGGGEEVVREGLFYLNFPEDAPEQTTTMTVAVRQRGCAVTFEGPVALGKLDERGSLEVRLARGYAASVQIVNESGQPVPGALLRPYYPGPPMVEMPEIRTDASGSAVIEHVGTAPLNIRVLADGFQADEVTGLHLDPAKPYRWTLTPTQPLHGKVTASATGKPIAGAVIKLGGVRGPHNEMYYDPKQAPVLTTTDAQGDFVLGSVRADSRYYLFVEASGYGGAYLRGVGPSEGIPNVALGPELMIRGKMIHAPPSVIHLGKVYLQYGQTFTVGENSAGAKEENVDLKPVNGEADFTVGPFYRVYGEFPDPKKAQSWDRKPIGIYVDTWGRADFSIGELPISNFVFDLANRSDSRSGQEKTGGGSKPADAEADAPPKPDRSPAASPAPVQAAPTDTPPAVKANSIQVEATVSTEDGAPIGFHAAEIHPSLTFGPSGGHDYLVFPSFNSPEGTTTMRIPFDARDVSFAVTNKGYAVALAGPFSPPLEEKLKGLHFTLTKGFNAAVQVVDEAGNPIGRITKRTPMRPPHRAGRPATHRVISR